MIVDLSFNHVTTVTFLHLGDKFGLFIIELAVEFFLDQIDDWRVIELVGRFRKIFPAVKAL